eukprot:2923663-Amphidinium_carterae.1
MLRIKVSKVSLAVSQSDLLTITIPSTPVTLGGKKVHTCDPQKQGRDRDTGIASSNTLRYEEVQNILH